MKLVPDVAVTAVSSPQSVPSGVGGTESQEPRCHLWWVSWGSSPCSRPGACGLCTSIHNSSSSTHYLGSEFKRKKRQFLLNVTPCLQIHMYIDRLIDPDLITTSNQDTNHRASRFFSLQGCIFQSASLGCCPWSTRRRTPLERADVSGRLFISSNFVIILQTLSIPFSRHTYLYLSFPQIGLPSTTQIK